MQHNQNLQNQFQSKRSKIVYLNKRILANKGFDFAFCGKQLKYAKTKIKCFATLFAVFFLPFSIKRELDSIFFLIKNK
jgi:hypothetical protein